MSEPNLNDPIRNCQITTQHEPHRYDYEYVRPEHLGGRTTGWYICDGSPNLNPGTPS
jgi:hypothetical protein